MFVWPDNYENSWTLSKTVGRVGIGLHSGKESEVLLGPSEECGFYVSWLDSDCNLPLKIGSHQVRHSQLCTSLHLGGRNLSTVEHLLAALAGCGLTHVEIKVKGDEIPLLDGSALCWIEAINEAGLRAVSSSRSPQLKLEKPLTCYRKNSVISATPADEFNLVGVIDFPQKAIGHQIYSIQLTPERFINEIAPARTFGFLEQLDYLKQKGLIKGGGLDNALVCDDDHWINPPLRFPDEPVRHKLLDLIGDLALVGFPKAQVLVYRGSHALHTDLANALAANTSLT